MCSNDVEFGYCMCKSFPKLAFSRFIWNARSRKIFPHFPVHISIAIHSTHVSHLWACMRNVIFSPTNAFVINGKESEWNFETSISFSILKAGDIAKFIKFLRKHFVLSICVLRIALSSKRADISKWNIPLKFGHGSILLHGILWRPLFPKNAMRMLIEPRLDYCSPNSMLMDRQHIFQFRWLRVVYVPYTHASKQKFVRLFSDRIIVDRNRSKIEPFECAGWLTDNQM